LLLIVLASALAAARVRGACVMKSAATAAFRGAFPSEASEFLLRIATMAAEGAGGGRKEGRGVSERATGQRAGRADGAI